MPDRRRAGRSTLPDQRTLLSWLFVGRLVLAVGILLGAGLVWTERPQESFLVTVDVVIALVAVLGHRLREAGMEQQTLAIELKRVRLEADDILRNIRSGVLTVDGVGRLAFINPTGQKLLDLDGEGLIGMPVLDQLKVR